MTNRDTSPAVVDGVELANDERQPCEVWTRVDIPTSHPYEVSNMGHVRSLQYVTDDGKRRSEYLVAQEPNSAGYLRVSLLVGKKKQKKVFVHRLVAHAFVASVDGKQYVNHINGNKHDNRSENLEWCTPSENITHSWRVLHPESIQRGEDASHAMFTNEQAKMIRDSDEHVSSLAAIYGVTESTIYGIKRRRSYSCVA